MKEQLHTIPISDAIANAGECPFCYIEQKTEEHMMDFVLGHGASYMEADIRDMTDREGFCRAHFKKMFDYGNSLGNAWILKTLMNGGTGGIAGCANVYPHTLASIYNSWASGDIETAQKCQDAIAPLRGCFRYGNPNTVIKTAVSLLGYAVGKCRAPFNQLPEEGIRALKAVLETDQNAGLH